MTVETAPFISSLNPALPALTDPEQEGRLHIELIKTVLQATFPNLNAAVTPTPAQLNVLASLTAPVSLLNNGGMILRTYVPNHSNSANNQGITVPTGITLARVEARAAGGAAGTGNQNSQSQVLSGGAGGGGEKGEDIFIPVAPGGVLTPSVNSAGYRTTVSYTPPGSSTPTVVLSLVPGSPGGNASSSQGGSSGRGGTGGSIAGGAFGILRDGSPGSAGIAFGAVSMSLGGTAHGSSGPAFSASASPIGGNDGPNAGDGATGGIGAYFGGGNPRDGDCAIYF